MKNTYKCDHCGYIYCGRPSVEDEGAIICEGQEGCPRCDGPQATMICKYCGKQVCECISMQSVYRQVQVIADPVLGGYIVSDPTGGAYLDIACLIAWICHENEGEYIVKECDWTEEQNIRGHIEHEEQLIFMLCVETDDSYRYYGIVEA